MACFSCSNNKTESEIGLLQRYKEASEKTGKSYWFFKKNKNNEIFIMDANEFKEFKKKNNKDFKSGLYEFRHISEFRDAENIDVFQNT